MRWPARTSSPSAAAARRVLARWFSAVIGSPRRNSALPPSATTTRNASAPDGRDQDGLDRGHPVFRLLEDDGSLGLEDFVGHLHAVDTEALGDVGADFR